MKKVYYIKTANLLMIYNEKDMTLEFGDGKLLCTKTVLNYLKKTNRIVAVGDL